MPRLERRAEAMKLKLGRGAALLTCQPLLSSVYGSALLKKKTGLGLSRYYVKVSALFLVKVSRSVIIFMFVHETITLRSEGFA